jgi:hypothetical protein
MPCFENGRAGRDTTTRAAKYLKSAATQQATAELYREWGDAANADASVTNAEQIAAKANALLHVAEAPVVKMGEAVSPKRRRLVDTLMAPNVAALDASAHRLELLGRLGLDCTAMALDAADSIQAQNSFERMLAHQMAVAHKTSLEIVDKASFMPETNDKARMLKVACRMMDTFQRGLLTLQRIRSNGEQRITVQYVTVADGGQAIIGDVNHGGTAK